VTTDTNEADIHTTQEQTRTTAVGDRINLNRDWKFSFGEHPGAHLHPADEDWYDVGLPHSFGLPDFRETAFYVGYGCYRRTVDVEPEWVGKWLALEFQGVFQRTEVYVNGAKVGGHEGGYTPFIIDISNAVRPGSNDVSVRVDNLWNAQIAPRAGDYSFNGGIYRDVALLIREPARFAWHGISVTTPTVSAQEATVAVDLEVRNGWQHAQHARVTGRIVDPDGIEVAQLTAECEIASGATATLRLEASLDHPLLWHPDHPHLYRLESALEVDGVVVDGSSDSFGVRWFEFTADRGFFLNGEHLELHGANVHQDHGGWGDAVTQAGMRRDVAMVKELGMNIIRGSHYPHHLAFTDACDELGVLYWSELPFWGAGGDNIEGYWFASAYPVEAADEAGFEASCRQTLTEMIRTQRNSPSVVVWSVGNEVFFSDEHVIDKARQLTVELVDLAHELDPSRPVAVGGAQRRGFDLLGDIAGYNGDGAELFVDPGIPNLVTEYHGVHGLGQGDEEVTWQTGVLTSPPWRSGKILWCAYHYRSVLPGAGIGGIVSYFRIPRRPYFWYREKLRGIPRPPRAQSGVGASLRLSADVLTIPTDGTGDTKLTVETLDAAGNRVDTDTDVVLTVTAGAGLFPSGTSITLSPRTDSMIAGEGAIELRAYRSGEITVEASAPGLPAAQLSIHAIEGPAWDPVEPRRLPTAAPELTAAPAIHQSSSLSAFRPTLASSAEPGHPSANITDGNDASFWRAATSDGGEWVQAGLEFAYEISRVRIEFADDAPTEWKLETTADHERFEPVDASGAVSTAKSVIVELPKRVARAVRIRFLGAPRAVARIDVF